MGEAVLDVVNQPETLVGVVERGELFRQVLQDIAQNHGVFSQIRGKGLLIGAVLSEPWQGRAAEFLAAAEAENVLVLMAGPNVVRFAPSLVIEPVDIREGLQRFARAVQKLCAS